MSPRRDIDLLRQSLDRRRTGEADIEWMRYVGPLGRRGLHKVRPKGSEKPILVSGPRRTWKPGEIVPVGSHTGTQGRTILASQPAQRGAPFPLVTQKTQPVAPVVAPTNPLEIFGGSLELWFDIYEQGTAGLSDGDPVSSFTDFSGNGRNGTGTAMQLLASGANGLPSWHAPANGQITHTSVLSTGFPEPFSIYLVFSMGSGADVELASEVWWRNADAKVAFLGDGGTINTAPRSNITYPAGTMVGFGLTAFLSGGVHELIFQSGVTEDPVTPVLSASSWGMSREKIRIGELRMVVASSLDANSLQRSQMATYMNFIISGGWA